MNDNLAQGAGTCLWDRHRTLFVCADVLVVAPVHWHEGVAAF